MTTPKLAELSPEQRRVLCAEKLGIKPDGLGFWTSSATGGQIPWTPDESHDDAFKLVEWMREKGWRYCVSTDEWRGGHHAQFVWPDYSKLYEATEDTAPKAIVSAFLLATGAAA